MVSSTKNPNMKEGIFSKHTLMMVLGCVIPILLIGILWVAGVSKNILFFGLLLLCPIMYLMMMKNMKRGRQNPERHLDENKKEELT